MSSSIPVSSKPVFRLRYGNNGNCALVKHFSSESRRTLREMLKYAETLRETKCKHLVPITEVSLRVDILEICVAWMPNGSLHSLIYQKEVYPTIPYCMCVKILADVAEGLNHLHSLCPPLVHQGLKPCNILMDGKYNAKISDAGMATLRKMISKSSSDSYRQSIMYQSPEMLLGGKPSPDDDSYSFGVNCQVTFGRQPPFYDSGYPVKLITKITQGCRPQPSMESLLKAFDIPPSQRTQLSELVNCCWHRDPALRPSMATCSAILRKIQETFTAEEMEQSVNSLLKHKISRLTLNGQQEHRNRTQSTEERSNVARVQMKERSASMPCSCSGEHGLPSRSIPPAANHMLRPTPGRYQTPNPVSCPHGHSSLVPISEDISRMTSQNKKWTEKLNNVREKVLHSLTEGRLNQLLDILKSSQLFSRDEYESVKSKETTINKVRQLLDTCLTKGDRPSQVVFETVQQNGWLCDRGSARWSAQEVYAPSSNHSRI
uniref:Uncharacterized protein n=1 Tax=Leptobrachium leishanense TaxID=445787 RepID=A0A8C5QE87_9ANUR